MNRPIPAFVLKIGNSFFILYEDNLVLSVSEEKAESLMNNNAVPLKQLNYRHQLEDKDLYNKILKKEI